MTRAEIVALFNKRDDAWERHDVDALATTHSEDAVAESPMLGRLVGRDRIREVYASWFHAFPDLKMVTDTLMVDGHQVAEFFTTTGTQMQPFGGIAASGRQIRITGAWLYTLDDDGRITHDRRLYDVTALLVQLGILRTKLHQESGPTAFITPL